ncbi:autotransporter outer membrane beta-barrel domain-containing protein [Helicobacter cappadocius]|uniref:Autotransporter outer membrane beta-barrel domain-containing protein n=1 Tax=Helicobacter cappadocius TaxID=3063998 RepID=A0AA90PSD7_9HELI|nr:MULTISPECIES: autotransporter outer membrane beta-barrel domain-containing protein [unclassified Helicobacter]MDO7253293.1 autotransporter outer membrane beta-barrel domain-containing protein [Helicobacter sp. faydin-H75]MDP2539277.1 autotransporter outer membrane beta-barrel domain-containing protein [Helicobacter sp. faydin-H76]
MRKSIVPLCFVYFLSAQEWENFPMGTTALSSGDSLTIQANGTTDLRGNNLYNLKNFTYKTNGSASSTLTVNVNSAVKTFYNRGSIDILENSNLILNTSTNFAPDMGSSINISKNASLQATGAEFTSTGGILINRGRTTLNFPTINIKASGNMGFLNDGGILEIDANYLFNGRTAEGIGAYGVFETTNSGTSTINLKSGYLSNFGYLYDIYSFSGKADGKTSTNTISILKSNSKATLIINGGDVLNGGDVGEAFGSSSTRYRSGAGYIIADDGNIKIQKNLTSQGAGSHLSQSNISDIVRSKIQAINNGVIEIAGNFTNKSYSDIYLNNTGQINIAGSFISNSNTNIYFSGNTSGYGIINAKSIEITNANIFLYKGNAKTDTSYIFLKATDSLAYNHSILGEKDAISEDGSVSLFYKLLVEDKGKTLEVTFKEIPYSGDLSDIISQTTDISQNEKGIIDGFDEKKPIDDFDIKNLSAIQIKNLAKNIQSGMETFVHNKNNLSQLRFQASSSEVFNRMIRSHSVLSSNKSLTKYALNSIDTRATYRTDAGLPSIYSKENDLTNSIYISILGGYQKITSGYGYGYGVNIGYDKLINENLFLGSYVGYNKNDLDLDVVKIQSDNLQIGIYGQANFSIFQTDIILGYDYSNSKSIKDISILSKIYSNNAGYNTNSFNGLFQIGIPFNFSSNIIKPYIGLATNINHNTHVNEKGNALASQYLFGTEMWIRGIIGVEYIKYFQNAGYFFIRPSMQYTFYNNQKNTEVIFLGNTLNISALPAEHFGNILTGAQIPINESLFINLNLSLSASTNKTFMSIGSASVKFLF